MSRASAGIWQASNIANKEASTAPAAAAAAAAAAAFKCADRRAGQDNSERALSAAETAQRLVFEPKPKPYALYPIP